MPIGIEETDRFFALLEKLSGRAVPEKYRESRGRLVDAYVDGHKYVFGKKAIVYGEEDLVVGLTAFLAEIGIRPMLCASGGTSRASGRGYSAKQPGTFSRSSRLVHEGMDFFDISEMAESLAAGSACRPFKGVSAGEKTVHSPDPGRFSHP